jgi:uncharacterized phiE125 gp8 family phage protein
VHTGEHRQRRARQSIADPNGHHAARAPGLVARGGADSHRGILDAHVHAANPEPQGAALMDWQPIYTRWTPPGGTWAARVITPPNDDDILTLAELADRTHVTESDALMTDYRAAARRQVERDTGCALTTQTIQVAYDVAPVAGDVFVLPCPPLQAVAAITFVLADGTTLAVDPATAPITLDAWSFPARLCWNSLPIFPQSLATFQPLRLNLVVGWTGPAYVPPASPPFTTPLPSSLKHAVGLLASHYLTYGRDLVSENVASEIPMGYDDAIAPYQVLVLV